jgi:hypothetical protein
MSLASFFGLNQYRSDATQFIDQLKTDRPQLEREQQVGRSLLWDKQLDRDVQADLRAGQVPQKPYVYQTES